MTDLSPKARALLQTGRSAIRPSDADRARIESGLRERLGADALSSVPAPKPTARILTSWPIAAALALTVCVLGLTAFMLLQRSDDNRQPPPQPAPMSTVPPTPPTSAAPSANEPPSTPPAQVREAPEPAPRDRLSREVALLSRATSALHAGDSAAALKALEEHQRKFPNGLLVEERRAAKALALCSLGRFSEGRSELARLAPHSPEAQRAREQCKLQP